MAKREYIIAPAGHGKTHYITRLVNGFTEKKALVLTHTNAGLNSLVKKLKRGKVPSENYDISTIDSFSVKYATSYPALSNVEKTPENNTEYEHCRKGVIKVFEMGFLQDYIYSTYSLIIVDEYQDCSEVQHNLILKLSENVDLVILGDPMQGIFDFRGKTKLANWNEIRKDFIESEIKLEEPWRWRQIGYDGQSHEELGEWIKNIRNKLKEGEELEFKGSDIHFLNIESDTEVEKKAKIRAAIRNDAEVLILVDDPTPDGKIRKRMSHGLPEAQIINAMDFAPFYESLRMIGEDNICDVLTGIKSLLKMSITRVDQLFLNQIETKVKKLSDTKAKTVPELRCILIKKDDDQLMKKINHLYHLFLDVLEKQKIDRIGALLDLIDAVEGSLSYLYIKGTNGRKVHGVINRRDIISSVKNTLLRYIDQGGKESLEEYGRQIRQRISYIGRGFKKVIATTLLTKGLEYDHVIIDNPENFETKHLYVALSRAKRKITILGNNQRIRKEIPENL